LDFQTKTQNLIFAVQNTKLNSFNYCVGEYGKYNYQTYSSGDLLPLIFLCFRREDPFLLVKQYRLVQSEYGCDSQLESRQAFRVMLSNQIHELTGVKPRFVFKEEEDKYWIYYS
jgi:hypothetical protein